MKVNLEKKLFLLTSLEDRGYDEANGFVILADDSKQAREIAAQKCGDEGVDVWMQAHLSKCELIGCASGLWTNRKSQVVLRDFNTG